MLASLILLNLAGGTSVDDLKIINADPGFCELLHKAELQGLKRKERRELVKRWRKEKNGLFPLLQPFSGIYPDFIMMSRALFCSEFRDGNVPAGYEQLRVFKWAEICFVPNKIGHSKKGSYRYIAKRQALAAQYLPGMEDPQMSFPFPVMEMENRRYKIFDKDESHPVFHHQSAGPSGQTIPSVHIEDLQRPPVL